MAQLGRSEAEIRRRVSRVFVVQGIAGLLTLVALTAMRADETRRVFMELGSHGPLLVISLFLFISALGLLKFELTNLVFVSMVIVGDTAMFPLLGPVMSAWIAVLAAMATRIVTTMRGGSTRDERGFEALNTFRFFATYGIPVIAGSILYEAIGGRVPIAGASGAEVARIAASGVLLMLVNNLLMESVMMAYGYSLEKRLRLSVVDVSIYLLALPFALCLTLSLRFLGFAAFLALAFTAIVINYVAKRLANARAQTRNQLQRLVSLSTIGKTISLNFTTEELLETIYQECRKVVDVSMFSIALLDDAKNELAFEIEYVNDERRPKDRLPEGDGLNWWVIRNHKPLLLRSSREEQEVGVVSIEDGLMTESWLGVPMVARDRVIGVISIQSFHKNAFTREDEFLLTAIANQAAVALENANLYRDLEGLTYALEHRVQERTNELRETNLRLLAADRSKNQFLANMSHELRTPLNSIIGFSDVLLESVRTKISERKYGFLGNIRQAGRHLLDLISDILDLSKIEAGKMELHVEEFDIRNVLEGVERIMHGYREGLGVELEIRIAPDVPHVRLDEGRLKQILFNLLSNALKFSHRGGVVTVDVAVVPADQSLLHQQSLRIRVIDRGIGMEEEELRKIFDEFYQTEDGRRVQRGGTGLGLSLAQNFVELHGGRIEVESALGAGSTFTIHLPVVFEEPAAADERADGISRQLSPGT